MGDRLLRRCRRDDQQVDVGRRESGALDRFGCRRRAERRGGFVRSGNSAFANARPLDDPRIIRVDTRREIVVCDRLRLPLRDAQPRNGLPLA
jgi:hypothetical protein